MKIWTTEHIFSHPWETVVQAVWQKYPNPMNPAVVGVDVVDRRVTKGVLKTHRLISTKWGLPSSVTKVLGADRMFYASEHSVVDPVKKSMILMSKNITFCKEVSIVEKMTYSPHPSKEDCTIVKQKAEVTIHGIPLSSYLEGFITGKISVNSSKGKQGMEWVITKINKDVQELTSKTVKSMDDLVHLSGEPLTNFSFRK
ncbi:PRELI domain containing protein 3B-like isoform X1 [Limulus polyphemus]|uniref:PRELI domain containing protein 3B-like isoform X1 n=1 Tax=Limulus polyphemus TaxID=6850 RepID=A0ABM1BY52_LIMPO|nr:PRELI domain containing protein 3B-like isoform X1 [Limulus polyphemus]